jgi:hypothetical protein
VLVGAGDADIVGRDADRFEVFCHVLRFFSRRKYGYYGSHKHSPSANRVHFRRQFFQRFLKDFSRLMRAFASIDAIRR